MNNIKFRFHGRTAHAAANPETGRSALDAVELMNIGVNYLREHMIEQARIHYVITNGGGAPNVVPDDAEVWYFIRSPERHQVEELTERVRKVAQGAALMTETRHGGELRLRRATTASNDVIGDHMMEVLEELGPIEFTDEEIAYAKTIADALPGASCGRSLLEQAHAPGRPARRRAASARSGRSRDRGKVMPGSTDVVRRLVDHAHRRRSRPPPGRSASRATAGRSPPPARCRSGTRACSTPRRRWRSPPPTCPGPALLAKAKAEHQQATSGLTYRAPIPEGAVPPQPYIRR